MRRETLRDRRARAPASPRSPRRRPARDSSGPARVSTATTPPMHTSSATPSASSSFPSLVMKSGSRLGAPIISFSAQAMQQSPPTAAATAQRSRTAPPLASLPAKTSRLVDAAPTIRTSAAYKTQRPTPASALVQGDVRSRSTTISLPGAGVWPTPKAKAPLSTWPSTAETTRQLTVYTPSAKGLEGSTSSASGSPATARGFRDARDGSAARVKHSHHRDIGLGRLGEGEQDALGRSGHGGSGGRVGALESRVRGGGAGERRRHTRGEQEQRRHGGRQCVPARLHHVRAGRRRRRRPPRRHRRSASSTCPSRRDRRCRAWGRPAAARRDAGAARGAP